MHSGKNIDFRVRQFQVQILDLPLTKLFTFRQIINLIGSQRYNGDTKGYWKGLNVYIDRIAHHIVGTQNWWLLIIGAKRLRTLN